MKTVKKLTSIVLAMLMLISAAAIAPINAAALTSGDFEYNVLSNGKAEITAYKGSVSNITVPNILGGHIVAKIGECAFSGCEKIINIKIPSSITSIGAGAFDNCDNIKNVYIADLAAWCKIDFSYPNGDYSHVTPLKNGASLYLNNFLITDLVIPDSVKSVNNDAFSGCGSIKSLTVSDKTTCIGEGAFENCENLEKITIPDSLADIGANAFASTKWYNMQPVGFYSIGKVFGYKYKYNKNGILVEKSEPVIAIVKDKLKGIAGGAFKYDDKLVKAVLPSDLQVIGDQAFGGCDNLLNITIPKSVTKIGKIAVGFTEENEFSFKSIKGFKIYGYKGTAAEKYSKNNNITFKNAEKYSESKTIKMKAGVVGKIAVLSKNDKVTYKTSKKKVVKVSKNGELSTLKKGTAKISIKVGSKTYKYTIKVKNNPKLKINKKAFSSKKIYSIKKGKVLKVKISGKASSVKNTYKSSKKKIAKVISKQTAKTVKIKGYKRGRTTITLKVNGVKFKIKIRVK